MPTPYIVSVGPGKTATNLAGLRTHLDNRDLVANDEIGIAEFYYEPTEAEWLSYANLTCRNCDATRYWILRPAAGLGFKDLNPPGGPYNWANGGLIANWRIGTASGGSAIGLNIRSGVSVQGFRVNLTGTAANDTAASVCVMLSSWNALRHPELTGNFIRSTVTGAAAVAILTYEFGHAGTITDNIFYQPSGTAKFLGATWGANVERNTFVRTGTAANITPMNWSAGAGESRQATLRNNLYVGCGAVPVQGIPAAASQYCTNNYTDAAITGNTGGFTVLGAGTIVEDPDNNLLPKAASAVIGGANSTAHRTKDIRGYYRGTAADAGALQLTAQALPPFATAAITNISITDQTVVITGTTSGTFASGTMVLKKAGVPVVSKSPTFGTGTFTVTFTNVPGGNYDIPQLNLTNDAGAGPDATGGATFTVVPPVLPVATFVTQKVVGRKVLVMGTVINSPTSGSISLAAAATPNGAVSQAATPVTIVGNQFTAVLQGVPGGNYAAPAITFTNGAGTTTAMAGTSALTITPFVATPIPGINIQTVGLGQTHANWAAFATWLSSRNLVTNNEMIYAYVADDQKTTDIPDLTQLSGHDDTHYCVIMPAPGLGVDDVHRNDGYDYGIAGIEIARLANYGAEVNSGIIIQGFRMRVDDPAQNTGRVGWMLSARSSATPVVPATMRYNRFWSSMAGDTNVMVQSGLYGGTCRITDNLFIISNGGAIAFNGGFTEVLRNTFVRRGTAVGKRVGNTSYLPVKLNDNIFIGAGGEPVTYSNGTPTERLNNLTDTTLTTATSGITKATNIIVNVDTDARPVAAGPAIGTASAGAYGTKDCLGKNRGLAPDIGAYQLNGFVPTPVAAITSWEFDGDDLILSGTVTNSPTEGSVTLSPTTSNSDGAVGVGPLAITAANGVWTIRVVALAPGNYKAPTVIFKNAGGNSAAASGAQPISVIDISGNPTAPDVELVAPTVTVNAPVIKGTTVSLTGTMDMVGDASGKVEVYIDPLPSGAALGPFPATLNLVNKTWAFSRALVDYNVRLRVLATANDMQEIKTATVKILKSSGTPKLPLK
jgi:hypothetical protein